MSVPHVVLDVMPPLNGVFGTFWIDRILTFPVFEILPNPFQGRMFSQMGGNFFIVEAKRIVAPRSGDPLVTPGGVHPP
jgi:hypothetical protein